MKLNEPIIDARVLLDGLDGVTVVHVGTRMGGVDPIPSPGSINLAFTGNLIDGRFRLRSEQPERFAVLANDGGAIVYCASGVTACHNAIAIEAVGLLLPRVYAGSWSGWSTETTARCRLSRR